MPDQDEIHSGPDLSPAIDAKWEKEIHDLKKSLLQERLIRLDAQIQLLGLVRQQTQKELEGLLCQPKENLGDSARD